MHFNETFKKCWQLANSINFAEVPDSLATLTFDFPENKGCALLLLVIFVP